MKLRAVACLALVAGPIVLAASHYPQSSIRSQWRSPWIWCSAEGHEKNIHVYFRKTFRLDAVPEGPLPVLVTAATHYTLFVNGRQVGFGPPISDRRYHYYDTRDIGPFLQKGENVIAAHVYSLATGTEDFHGGRGIFLLEGTAGTAVLDTGADWKYLIPSVWKRDTPRQSFQLHFVEVADLRNEPLGWNRPGFNDSEWKPAVVVGKPPQGGYENLVARDLGDIDEVLELAPALVRYGEVQRGAEQKIPAVRINGETIEAARTVRISDRLPISVQTTAPGRDAALIFDMGRMVIGCPYFQVDGAAGAEIDVSISEYLDHGRVLAARRITSDQSTYLTDSVTLRNGLQEWKRYDYNGYRYIQLTIRNAPKPIVIHKLGTVLRNYRYAGEATFHSSDPVLDRIFEYAKWTHKVNTHWGYCGSAWREHAQWSDLAWAAMNETVFNDAGQMRYYLHQITLSQDAQGRMRFPYPGNEAIELPEQTMWLAEELSRSGLQFGDVQMMRDLFPAMESAGTWFRKHLSANGLMTTAGEWKPLWLVVDWGYPFCNNPAPGELATLNIIYYDFLRSVARVANGIGESEAAASYTRLADVLGETIQRTFYAPDEKRYYEQPGRQSPSPFAGVLAVQYGLAPEADRAAVFDQAVGKELRPGKASPWFMHNVLETFGLVGRPADAIASMKRYWGTFLNAGSTVYWELWNIPGEDVHPLPGYTAEMGGQTITYSSGPGPFVVRHILGVQPLANAYAHTLIAPHFAGLPTAEGSAPTPLGDVRLGWESNAAAHSTDLHLAVPQGMTAEFHLPYVDDEPLVTLDGRPFFDGSQFTLDDRIKDAKRAAGRLEMKLSPGTYYFSSYSGARGGESSRTGQASPGER